MTRGEKISQSLKKQYAEGKRKSYFKNDGSAWKGKSHSEETKAKLSSKIKGMKMSEEFKKKRSDEMKKRYAEGWQPTAGRAKKISYTSPIAGELKVDGTWELGVCKYLDEKGIKWSRNKKRFPYKDGDRERTYCPDFYLEETDTYIEVKGYVRDLDRIKWSQFPLKLEVWDKEVLRNKGIL